MQIIAFSKGAICYFHKSMMHTLLYRHLSFLQDQVIYTWHVSVWILIFPLPVICPLIYCRKINYTINISHFLVDLIFLLMSWLSPWVFKFMYWMHVQPICSNLQSTIFHYQNMYFLILWLQVFAEKTFQTSARATLSQTNQSKDK